MDLEKFLCVPKKEVAPTGCEQARFVCWGLALCFICVGSSRIQLKSKST